MFQEERLEGEQQRRDKHLDHQTRIERLQQEKEELQIRLEMQEAEAQKKIGELEAEREDILAQIEAKDAAIAKHVAESGPIEVDLDPEPFQDASGNDLFTRDMPIVSEIDSFDEDHIDYLTKALEESGVDLTLFDLA